MCAEKYTIREGFDIKNRCSVKTVAYVNCEENNKTGDLNMHVVKSSYINARNM